MLADICRYCRNFFEREVVASVFTVADGQITCADGQALSLLPGQYYRIVGSVFNDGVYRYGEDVLADETFSGAVWAMAVPPDFIQLCEEIDAWCEANAKELESPYQSENIGGYYSYTLKSGSASTGDSGGLSWQSQFAKRLAPWRKI